MKKIDDNLTAQNLIDQEKMHLFETVQQKVVVEKIAINKTIAQLG